MKYDNINEIIHICPNDYMNLTKKAFIPSRVELLIKDINQSIEEVIENISTATSALAAAAQPPVKEQLRTDPKAAQASVKKQSRADPKAAEASVTV